MQARVGWVLIIVGTQVIEKKRPVRPVFPDNLSVSYDYGIMYLYVFFYVFFFILCMFGFDGAEICEVIGIYILHKLGEKYEKERIGLYRDDGLACFENTSVPEAERIRKAFIKLFKNEFSLNIVSETNLKLSIF